MEIMDTIKEQVESNQVLLYMKGSPNQPAMWILVADCSGAYGLRSALCLCGYPV